jgi:hypothetical protein
MKLLLCLFVGLVAYADPIQTSVAIADPGFASTYQWSGDWIGTFTGGAV